MAGRFESSHASESCAGVIRAWIRVFNSRHGSPRAVAAAAAAAVTDVPSAGVMPAVWHGGPCQTAHPSRPRRKEVLNLPSDFCSAPRAEGRIKILKTRHSGSQDRLGLSPCRSPGVLMLRLPGPDGIMLSPFNAGFKFADSEPEDKRPGLPPAAAGVTLPGRWGIPWHHDYRLGAPFQVSSFQFLLIRF